MTLEHVLGYVKRVTRGRPLAHLLHDIVAFFPVN